MPHCLPSKSGFALQAVLTAAVCGRSFTQYCKFHSDMTVEGRDVHNLGFCTAVLSLLRCVGKGKGKVQSESDSEFVSAGKAGICGVLSHRLWLCVSL